MALDQRGETIGPYFPVHQFLEGHLPLPKSSPFALSPMILLRFRGFLYVRGLPPLYPKHTHKRIRLLYSLSHVRSVPNPQNGNFQR